MYLVTNRKVNVEINPQTRKSKTVTKTEAHVEYAEGAVEDILKRRAGGDDRVHKTRVFELEVSDDGEPSIGDEVS